MGRTVPSYRDWLEGEILRLQGFRKALRDEDKVVFDEIIEMARRHASAASYLASEDPFKAVLLSILIELRKELKGKP